MAEARSVSRSRNGMMAVLWGMVTLKPRTDKARRPATAVSRSSGRTAKGTYTQFMSRRAKARLCMRGEREWATGQPMTPTTAASPESSRPMGPHLAGPLPAGCPPVEGGPIPGRKQLGQAIFAGAHGPPLHSRHLTRQVRGVVRGDEHPHEPRPAGPVHLLVDAAHGADEPLNGHFTREGRVLAHGP